MKRLSVGHKSANGQVEIIAEDKYCYLVRNVAKGAVGVRTINKQLLNEFVEYFADKPNNTSTDARDELTGSSTIDRFEYGYNSTLTVMAKMVLGKEEVLDASVSPQLFFDDSYGPLQQVFYGAPGTGKSHTVNYVTEQEDTIRTTFHPDTDYASFVGAYKPSKDRVAIVNELGQPIQIAGTYAYKDQIVYKFIAQSFLKAYIEAWKKYASKDGVVRKQFLVVEEINRGNCAQIFGDLFQLLDRNDQGFSDYPIYADADLKKHLQEEFSGLVISRKNEINELYSPKRNRDVVSEVLNGDILLLPNNLYIWATMNTSDQSLFPIDSAFKRRWEWQYIPISDAHKGWYIEIGQQRCDWWSFLSAINDKIAATTNSEDKKLGYYFCKANDKCIPVDKFVSKVIFYLWTDVFKDYDFNDEVFDDAEGGKLTFDKFYMNNGLKSKVRHEKVILFLKNLGLDLMKIEKVEEDVLVDDAVTNQKRRLSVIMPNGEEIRHKNVTQTFKDVINYIGPDKVESLNLKVSKYPLVSKSKVLDEKGYGNSQHELDGGYWLITKLSTAEKSAKLQEIIRMLKLDISVKLN